MTRHKGYVLALLGFAILVGSLVLSSPFAGRSEERAAAPTGGAPGGLTPPALPPPAFSSPARSDHGTLPYQESGPIVFVREELETQLTFPVPLGRNLVIESVSMRANVSAGQRAAAVFLVTCGGNSTHFAIPLAPQGTFGKQDVYAGTHPLRAHAAGGTTVWVRLERSAPGESDSGFVTLAGRLE
jgi:hypothetical protein